MKNEGCGKDQLSKLTIKTMKEYKYLIILSLINFVIIPLKMRADVFEDYIAKYSDMAVAQMEEHHIPASITLAQGLLESSAGRSRLAREGNNHFGIKCHNGWQGETMLRDDDAPNECFRVYDNVEESYHDHSLFLKRERYKPLFNLELTDYQGWAKGLSKCGYATDPNYADRLVSIIERYALYVYDTEGLEDDETAEFIRATLSSNHPVRKSRGLYYVVAFPGDTYKGIAKEFGLSEKKLKGYNDAKGGDIREWEEVYLEPKKETGPEEVREAVIGEGESIRTISQRYGIKLESLKKLNKNAKDKPGTKLRLR